jgi:Protein of unknown function (DUF3592)
MLVGVVVVVLGIALGFFRWTGVPATETATTTGTFVHNGRWPGCEDTVAFKVDGRRFTTEVRTITANGGYSPAGSYCRHHQIGSAASIYYSPTDPAHASVQFNSPVAKWIAFILLGVLFAFLGWLFIPPPEGRHLGRSEYATTQGPANAPEPMSEHGVSPLAGDVRRE